MIWRLQSSTLVVTEKSDTISVMCRVDCYLIEVEGVDLARGVGEGCGCLLQGEVSVDAHRLHPAASATPNTVSNTVN